MHEGQCPDEFSRDMKQELVSDAVCHPLMECPLSLDSDQYLLHDLVLSIECYRMPACGLLKGGDSLDFKLY